MNNSLMLVVLVAVAAGLGLLLLLSPAEPAPAPVAVEPVVETAESVAEVPSAPEPASPYWEPVEGAVSVTVPAIAYVATAPCSPCGAVHAAPVVVAPAPTRAVGCLGPVSPCAKPACPVCANPEPVCVKPARVVGCLGPVSPCTSPACPVCVKPVVVPMQECAVGGCGKPVSPCAKPACEWPDRTCHDTCRKVVCEKPGINRNAPACLDECEFVQLHSNAAHPICSAVRFEWAASRGTFLNPNVSDPLYFAPTVCGPYGEDVWITLTITDEVGIRYTDQIKLFIKNRF